MEMLEILEKIFPDSIISKIKKSNFKIDGLHYHTRKKAIPSSGSKYPFNINRATLEASYEVLAFGKHNTFVFIIPIKILEEMYEDEEAYIDNHHPNIRIYTLDVETGLATFAKGGKKKNLSKYKIKIPNND